MLVKMVNMPAKMRFAMLLLLAPVAGAAVSVPAWFGDNMVFQVNAEYGARSFINGKAKPGEKVVVTFDQSQKFPAVADENGEWEVQFNRAGVGSGPGNVSIVGEDGPALTASNVMGGDVFFCSGQSVRAPSGCCRTPLPPSPPPRLDPPAAAAALRPL